jgi:hypothetical protein
MRAVRAALAVLEPFLVRLADFFRLAPAPLFLLVVAAPVAFVEVGFAGVEAVGLAGAEVEGFAVSSED